MLNKGLEPPMKVQLEVPHNQVVSAPDLENLVQDFNRGKHRVRDTVTGVASAWVPDRDIVYFCGYAGVSTHQHHRQSIITAEEYAMFAAASAVVTPDDVLSGICVLED